MTSVQKIRIDTKHSPTNKSTEANISEIINEFIYIYGKVKGHKMIEGIAHTLKELKI